MTRHLDTTDIVLIQMLLSDSRKSEREIGEFLQLPAEEVKKRIDRLVEDGIIRSFITRLTPHYLKSVGVLIFGRSEITKLEDGISQLGKHEATAWVAVASGGHLYASASLRRLSHLDSYIHFLKEEIGMEDPIFGIRSGRPVISREEEELSDLDFRILYSMRNDTRKSTFEVAEEVGVSRALIEEHLHRLTSEKKVEFSVILSPEKSSDVLCMFHLYRKMRGEMKEFMRQKLNEHSPNILFFNSFRNWPDLTTALTWTNDMAELREIKTSFESESVITRVEPNILLGSRAIETWGDRIIVERGAPR